MSNQNRPLVRNVGRGRVGPVGQQNRIRCGTESGTLQDFIPCKIASNESNFQMREIVDQRLNIFRSQLIDQYDVNPLLGRPS